jgi:hypothetical protein
LVNDFLEQVLPVRLGFAIYVADLEDQGPVLLNEAGEVLLSGE